MDIRKLSRALVVVGGINWGLVGLANIDLVATVTGNKFGDTNAASRLVYILVGGAAAAEAAGLLRDARGC